MFRLLTSVLLLFSVISLVTIFGKAEKSEADQPDPSSVQILERIQLGHWIHSDQPTLLVIRTQAELDQVGLPMGDRIVDFDQQSIVVVSLGMKPSTGYGVSIEELERKNGVVHVKVNTSSPEAGRIVGWALTYPQTAVIVQKIAATEKVVMELASGAVEETGVGRREARDSRREG